MVVGEDILQTMTENQAPEPPVQRPEAATAGEASNEGAVPPPDSLFSKVRPVAGCWTGRRLIPVRRLPRGTGVFRRENVHSLCDRLDGCLPL